MIDLALQLDSGIVDWSNPVSDHPLNSRLTAWWQATEAYGLGGDRMWDLASISCGSSHHGSLTNMDAATDWVVGEHGAALNFDGSNDYVNLNTGTAAVMPSLAHWTMDLFCRPTGTPANLARSFAFAGNVLGGSAGFRGICRANLDSSDDRLYGHVYDGASYTVETTYTAGDWTHLVLTQRGGSFYFYKDGVEIGSDARVPGNQSSAMGLAHNTAGGGNLYFAGDIKCARTWDRSFSDAEVVDLHWRTLNDNEGLLRTIDMGAGLSYVRPSVPLLALLGAG